MTFLWVIWKRGILPIWSITYYLLNIFQTNLLFPFIKMVQNQTILMHTVCLFSCHGLHRNYAVHELYYFHAYWLISSLLALESLYISSHLVIVNIQNQLTYFSLLFTSIQSFWISGYVGICGNELAEIAAKSVCSFTITAGPVLYMDYGPVFKAWLHTNGQSTWSEQHDNKLFRIKFSIAL